MKVAHITEEMARLVLPLIRERIREDVQSKAKITLPIGHDRTRAEWVACDEAIGSAERLWIETFAEFGYRFQLNHHLLFVRAL